MKKILISLVVIAAVSAAAVGATSAWFSDTDSVAGNTVAAGTLNVALGRDTLPLDIGPLAPGDTAEPAYLKIKNDGNLDMIFKVHVEPGLDQEDISDYIDVKVTLNPSSYTGDIGEYTLYGSQDNTLATNAPLDSLINPGLDNVSAACDSEDPWPLNPGYIAIYKLEVKLAESAPNTLQGKQFRGTIVVDAVQADNQDCTTSNIIWSN